MPEPYQEDDMKAVDALHKKETKERIDKEKAARAKLQNYGFEGELTGEAIF